MAGTLRGSAKFLGIAAGAVFAYWDFVSGGQAWDNKQQGLAIACYITSGLNAVSAGLIMLEIFAPKLLAALPGIGIAVFIAAIIVSAIVGRLSDSSTQKWVGQCIFGTYDEASKFKGMFPELEAFRKLGFEKPKEVKAA
jgi:hypothetical protein